MFRFDEMSNLELTPPLSSHLSSPVLMPRRDQVQIVHHQTESVIEDDDDVSKNTLNIPIHMEPGKGKSNTNVVINSRRIGHEPSLTSVQQGGIFSESETLR